MTIKPFSFAQKVAVYGDVDKRQTVSDYAKSHGLNFTDLQSKLAATGEINCDGGRASANVIDKLDVITTAFHVIAKVYNCVDPTNLPPRCTFKIDGSVNVIPIKRVLGVGPTCPAVEGAYKPYLDWAVLQLAKPVEGIIPYTLPDKSDLELLEHTKVVLVAAHSADWFQLDTRGGRYYPKHVGDCEIRGAYGKDGVAAAFSTDCDEGEGSSGGATLMSVFPTPPTLIGILVRGSETHDQTVAAKMAGRVNRQPFDEKHWGSRHIPLNGEFLAAVLSARTAQRSQ